MEIEHSNKAFGVLCWVAALPAAATAAWLAWIVINVLGRFSLGSVGVTPNNFLGKAYFVTAGHLAMGAVFVYIGAKVAPSYQVIVAFVFGALGIVVSGFLLFPAVMVKDWWAIWAAVCVTIGAGAVVWSVHAGDTDLG